MKSGLKIVWPAFFTEAGELQFFAQQRSFVCGFGVGATLPQFFGGCIKKNDTNSCGLEHRHIGWLSERASAKGDYRGVAIAECLQKRLQGARLKLAEGGFTAVAKDVGDSAAFTRFDLTIKVNESPPEAMGQCLADTGFPCTHIADKKHGLSAVGGVARCEHRVWRLPFVLRTNTRRRTAE